VTAPCTGDMVVITADRGDYGRTGVVVDAEPRAGSSACVVLVDTVRTTVARHDLRAAAPNGAASRPCRRRGAG